MGCLNDYSLDFNTYLTLALSTNDPRVDNSKQILTDNEDNGTKSLKITEGWIVFPLSNYDKKDTKTKTKKHPPCTLRPALGRIL